MFEHCNRFTATGFAVRQPWVNAFSEGVFPQASTRRAGFEAGPTTQKI